MRLQPASRRKHNTRGLTNCGWLWQHGGNRATHVTKNGKFEYMQPVKAANDGASFRPLAENTETMRRWSFRGGLAARRSRPLEHPRETKGPAKGRLKNGDARG